jgi:hypothetical protein
MVTPYANYKNRDYRAPGNIMPVTNSIEASILTHFTLNAAHFVFFTYPALRR